MQPPDDRLTDLPLREVLERLAAGTPAPGGGSASAIVCAAGAALVQMAATLSDAPAADADRARAAELRERAMELAELDLASYAPVLDALRRPGDDPERGAAVAAALSEAATVPMEIAEVASEIAGLAARTTQQAGRHLVGDAATATILAQAACAAAALLVELNLGGTGDERPARAAQCVADADVARQQSQARARGSRSPDG